MLRTRGSSGATRIFRLAHKARSRKDLQRPLEPAHGLAEACELIARCGLCHLGRIVLVALRARYDDILLMVVDVSAPRRDVAPCDVREECGRLPSERRRLARYQHA
eukprot:4276920-Prymnesium_polylepis.1